MIIFIECLILYKIYYRRFTWCYHYLKRVFFSFLAGNYNRIKSLNLIRDYSSRLGFSHYKLWFISSVSLFSGYSFLEDPKTVGIYQRALPVRTWTPILISSVLWNYWLFWLISQPLSLHLLPVISTSRLVLFMKASREKVVECLAHFNVFSFPLRFWTSKSGCCSSLDCQYVTSHPGVTTKVLSSSLTFHGYFSFNLSISPAHCSYFSKCTKRKRAQYDLTHCNAFSFPHISAVLMALWCLLVQSLSHVRLFATPWTAECQAFLSFIISLSLL